MNDIFAKIAINKIEEAINNGEFENLAGQGKPLNLDYLSSISPEMRIAYTVLKNSGIVPEEVHLLREIAEIREMLRTYPEGVDKQDLQKELRDKELKYNLLMEMTRRKRK
jgi:hypothetical protein